MYKYRFLTEPLLRLSDNFPLVVVSGARQVGKSTLLKHAFSSRAVFIDVERFSLAEIADHDWLDMLKATFQWFDIPAFSGYAIKRVSRKPKGFIADTGLACAAQLISSPIALSGHPMLGALFETAIAGEIRKLSTLLSTRPRIYHWRSAGGAEVDLMLERDGKLFPIEVKVKSQPSKSDTRGIAALRRSYPRLDIQPGLVIAPTDKLFKISDNDYALPWHTRV